MWTRPAIPIIEEFSQTEDKWICGAFQPQVGGVSIVMDGKVEQMAEMWGYILSELWFRFDKRKNLR